MNLRRNTKNDLALKKVRILFFGTDAFAIPSLDALIEDGYSIVGVLTTPDKPAGRNLTLTPPPIKIAAARHRVPVFQPFSLKMERWKSEIPESDLFIVAAYGKIIPKDILQIPSRGALNIHPSLLPRWRGPSPIQYTILSGDQETGITIMEMDELMDHGPIIARRKVKMEKTKVEFSGLHDELAKLGSAFLIETLPRWLRGDITPAPQDEREATYSKILKKEDGRIDWSRPAEEIERMIRAFAPWPGAWTIWTSHRSIMRLRIDSADVSSEKGYVGSPGSMWRQHHVMMVKTGRDSLAVKKITPEGKRSMVGDAFLAGHSEIIGAILR